MPRCSDVDECSGEDGSGSTDDSVYADGNENSGMLYNADGDESSGMVYKDDWLASTSLCPSHSTCTNTYGSYACNCDDGWEMAHASSANNGGTNTGCVDVDECGAGNGTVCSQHADCTNMPGSFLCSCKSGWYGDGSECNDVDECDPDVGIESKICHDNAVCTNSAGSFECSCLPGWEGDGTVCIDVDECEEDSSGKLCYPGASCNNTAGSFNCECNAGFAFTRTEAYPNGRCLDVDECAEVVDGSGTPNGSSVGTATATAAAKNATGIASVSSACHANAACANTAGSHTCTCLDGWVGDGSTSCIDVDECSQLSPCNNDAVCTNTPGSFTCECQRGWIGDGHSSCADIDECSSITLVDCKGRSYRDSDCAVFGGAGGPKTCFDLMLRWRDDDVCDASKPAFNCAELGCDGSDCTSPNSLSGSKDSLTIRPSCVRSPLAYVLSATCDSGVKCTNTNGGFTCESVGSDGSDGAHPAIAIATTMTPGFAIAEDDAAFNADMDPSAEESSSEATGSTVETTARLIKFSTIVIVVAVFAVIAVMLFVWRNPYRHGNSLHEMPYNARSRADKQRDMEDAMDGLDKAPAAGAAPARQRMRDDADSDSGVTLDAELSATTSAVSDVIGTSSSVRMGSLGSHYDRTLPGPRHSQRPQSLQQIIINNRDSLSSAVVCSNINSDSGASGARGYRLASTCDQHDAYAISNRTVVTVNEGDDDNAASSGSGVVRQSTSNHNGGTAHNGRAGAKSATFAAAAAKTIPRKQLSVLAPVLPAFPTAPAALTHHRKDEPRSGSILANRKWTLGRRVTPAASGAGGADGAGSAGSADGGGAGGGGAGANGTGDGAIAVGAECMASSDAKRKGGIGAGGFGGIQRVIERRNKVVDSVVGGTAFTTTNPSKSAPLSTAPSSQQAHAASVSVSVV